MKLLLILICCYYRSVQAVTNLNNLGGTFSSASLADGRTGTCATSGFMCTFSEPSCPYGNTNDDNQLLTVTGSPDQTVWQSSVGSSVLPDFPSVAVQLTETSPFGVLLSDPVTCQDSDGQVMFTYWATNKAILQVCAVSLQTNTDILCSENYNQQNNVYPGPINFKLPQAINEPFVIRFMASSPPEENFVILDELSYFGSGCSSGLTCNNGTNSQPASTVAPTTLEETSSAIFVSSTDKQKISSFATVTTIFDQKSTSQRQSVSTVAVRTTSATPIRDICSQLNCDFQNGFCQYGNFDFATIPWQRRDAKFGAPLSRVTDISPNGGYFLATLLKANRNDVSVLQSPQFRLNSDRILNFKFYRATMGSTIKLCSETDGVKYSSVTGMKECRSVIPELSATNARQWNSVGVTLARNVTKFYFVAVHEVQTSGDAGIAIDAISLSNC